MKPLYSASANVPVSRIVYEHRKALVPLGIVFAVNVLLLLVVVLPLSRRTAANEARAVAAEREEAIAAAEFKQA